ncbi:MAG: LytR/AlgR family response regulator transcription factor [Eubacteriaceae bacterium]
MNIVICDDEKSQQKKYKEIIQTIGKKKNIPLEIICFDSGKQLCFEAEDLIHWVEVVYLDINMPEIDGIETAKKLRSMGYLGEIIFLTVANHRILEAFDVEAMHYIIKETTSLKKFAEIFLKALKRAEERKQEVAIFSCAGETKTIPLKEIHYFEVNKHIITVYYGQEKFEFYSTLAKLEEMLFEKGFYRTHRRMLVSIKHIANLSYLKATLINGEEIPIGKNYYKQLKEYFEDAVGEG